MPHHTDEILNAGVMRGHVAAREDEGAPYVPIDMELWGWGILVPET
jgi:hypothetical protein